MTRRLPSFTSFMVFGALLSARWAHADPSQAELVAARHAFESAVSLESESHWGAATLKLREALVVKDTPGLRFHLAHCEAKQGLLVEAQLDYERANDLLQKGAKAPDVQKLLAPAGAALAPRIPRVTVQIPNDLSDLVAELDGKAYLAGDLAQGMPLNPGAHQLTVSAAGRVSFRRDFALAETDHVTIEARLPPEKPALPAIAAAQAKRPVPSRSDTNSASSDSAGSATKLVLLIGESALTAAGLAVGIGYKLAESSASDRIASAQRRIDQSAADKLAACGSPDPSVNGACADLRSAIDDHDQASTRSVVGFACAGVGAVALLTTLIVYPSSSRAQTGTRVYPAIGLGTLGLQGQF